ncbi:hypothetical protein [Actibacterium ureilyticum]|uniref:hypothetical protein n=1 Tax=Actibacterium ureilyticum TaxID=1590614 RepID=UPI0011409A9F|nr:hypothetical protein [Actibacterium ureilyticum]
MEGARITGQLDLEGARIPRDILLINCRFDAAPILRSAMLDTVSLQGSALPGFHGDRLSARGCVMLRECEVTEELLLSRATLGGDLSCLNAHLRAGESGDALFADGLDAKGGVFLQGVVATGALRLLGATLGGDLNCENVRLTAGKSGAVLSADRLNTKGTVFLRGAIAEGEMRFIGAQIGGDLGCNGARFTARTDGRALSLDSARINGTVFLRGGARLQGTFGLSGAVIGQISDDPKSWPQKQGDLLLNRCRYGAFVGTGTPVDAPSRTRWLSLQEESRWGQEFWPQPWEHCAKVLREMGHREDARTILIEKEKRQRAARRERMRKDALYEDAAWYGVWDTVLGWTVRYGRQPLLAFVWLFAFWLMGCAIYWKAGQEDAIKPNNPFVLRSAEWAYCAPEYAPQSTDARLAPRNAGETQRACFEQQAEAQSYPRFNPLIYSADTLLPIVHLEMQEYWIPNETAASPWGQGARIFLWAQIALGWALSLLAVAGFSGLVKTDSGT